MIYRNRYTRLVNPVAWLRVRANLTQVALATVGGTSQPSIAAYESDRRSPTLRTLVRLAAAAGLEAVFDYVPPMTREDRRSLHLHRAIAAELTARPREVLAIARRNLRLMRELNPHAAELLNEWRRSLGWPVQHLVDLMVDPRPRARDLRHLTPFAGVLSNSQRADVYREFAQMERVRR